MLKSNSLNLIFDEKKKFSPNPLLSGILSRSLGSGKKVAYIDLSKQSKIFLQFLENLAINIDLRKEIFIFNIETFGFDKNENLIRGILPSLEYQIIKDKKYLLKLLRDFDIIIFEDLDIGRFNIQFLSLILNSPRKPDIIASIYKTSNGDLKEIKNKMNLSQDLNIYEIKNIEKKNLISKKITFVEGDFSDLYIHGLLINLLLNKFTARLIAFDKGDQSYGEEIFFKIIKNKKEKLKLGFFDFAFTGNPNPLNNSLLIEKDQAKEGLKLLNTAMKKEGTLIIDNLTNLFERNILENSLVEKIFKISKHPIIINSKKLNNKLDLEFVSSIIRIIKIN